MYRERERKRERGGQEGENDRGGKRNEANKSKETNRMISRDVSLSWDDKNIIFNHRGVHAYHVRTNEHICSNPSLQCYLCI